MERMVIPKGQLPKGHRTPTVGKTLGGLGPDALKREAPSLKSRLPSRAKAVYPMDGTFKNLKGDPEKPRKFQEILLRVLGETTGSVDKGFLMRKVNEGYNLKVEYDYIILHAIGNPNVDSRRKMEKRLGYPALLTYGYVFADSLIIEGVATIVYSITAEGRLALAKLPEGCRWAK